MGDEREHVLRAEPTDRAVGIGRDGDRSAGRDDEARRMDVRIRFVDERTIGARDRARVDAPGDGVGQAELGDDLACVLARIDRGGDERDAELRERVAMRLKVGQLPTTERSPFAAIDDHDSEGIRHFRNDDRAIVRGRQCESRKRRVGIERMRTRQIWHARRIPEIRAARYRKPHPGNATRAAWVRCGRRECDDELVTASCEAVDEL